MAENKNISRIDNGHTHGWYVRIYGAGKTLGQKLFSDLKYGGKDLAFGKAQDYRDNELKELPPGRYPIQIRQHIKNRSGQIGVFRRTIKQRSGKLPEYWVGAYYIEGRRHEKAFSLTIHGEGKAYRLALAFRQAGMSEVSSKKIKYLSRLAG